MFALQAKITVDSAQGALSDAIASVDMGETEVDCDGIIDFDSSALAVLIALRRHAVHRGISLEFINLPRMLVSLATVYGIDCLVAGGN
ncbi:STAS domain-containing protein [Candidatus Pandoraea novymonadis]|uniref:STAS domain-containing protein n=1 Tax=Candidatus Pandoraea novymonadis TaxID=1808959 RepID=A0ABX5FDM3_9BURK|nr:STAS domain-containing protein [Candidatus Pandoraea novymonadis]PSB91573.1 hypothetical protein BZL35_00970 [Candidatus Pandoraea novymonadis]